MADRLPFQYGSGCSGPLVSIGDIPFLPICSFPLYTQPTLALHHVAMTLPDLAPPPLCPCIFTIRAIPFSVTYSGFIGDAGGKASLVFKPAALPQNCCEPTFKMSGKLKLPCMPFSTLGDAAINIGKIVFSFKKLSHCKLKTSMYISLPTTWVTAVNTVSYKSGQFTYTWKLVQVFAVQPGGTVIWATAEPCPTPP